MHQESSDTVPLFGFKGNHACIAENELQMAYLKWKSYFNKKNKVLVHIKSPLYFALENCTRNQWGNTFCYEIQMNWNQIHRTANSLKYN